MQKHSKKENLYITHNFKHTIRKGKTKTKPYWKEHHLKSSRFGVKSLNDSGRAAAEHHLSVSSFVFKTGH